MTHFARTTPERRLRPYRFFFPAAALLALAIIPAWLLVRNGSLPQPALLPPAMWHAEEMLFGYAFAVIAGYLLPPLTPLQLAAVATLWTGARIIWFLPDVPPSLLVAVAAAFPLLLAVAGAGRFSAIKRSRNYIFPAILLTFALTTALLFGASLVTADTLTRTGLILTLYLVVLLIIVMGGRLIPAVTTGALRGQGHAPAVHAQHGRELACIITMTVFMVFEITPLPAAGSAAAAWLLAALLLFRMKDWASITAWRLPEIWPLHLGYAWIVIGLVLLGFVRLGMLHGGVMALHALGAGGIGTITLAMMARLIRLQATGRHAPGWLNLVHLAFAVAVSLRVVGPWLAPASTDTLLWLSALAWSSAFSGLLAFFVTASGRR